MTDYFYIVTGSFYSVTGYVYYETVYLYHVTGKLMIHSKILTLLSRADECGYLDSVRADVFR